MAKQTVQRAYEEYLTIKEAFEEYLVEKEAENLSAKTLKDYHYAMKHFLSDMDIQPDYVYITDIDAQVIHKWISKLKKQGLKDISINSLLALIRAFLYWCMDEEEHTYIDKPYKIKLLKTQEAPPKHYLEEEVARLIEKPRFSASFPEWRSWAIVNFIIGTGARASTICNVTIGDLDFTRKEITLGFTKNNKALIVPISPALEIALKEYIRIWRKNAPNEHLLFPTRSNSKLTANSLWAGTNRFFRIREVKKTTIHGLRHTFAIGWVRNNGNMFTLQKILGHSTLDMTRKYVELFAEDIKINFEQYNPLDTAKRKTSRKQTLVRGK